IRAGEVVEGIELARERRAASKADRDLASGPARLTVAAGITLADDGTDLQTGPILLRLPDSEVTSAAVRTAPASGPRTGVSGPGGSDTFPWRFWIEGDATVSPYRASAPRRGPRPTSSPTR
ncbi:MAG: DNA-3-methyladenine glycosylase, partial [Glaciihabitans sp.]